MNFYPFHIGDYRGATAHLSNEEDVAYRRLIDMYYDTEQAIPLETQWVSRRLRVATEALKSVLSDFFVLADDGWHNARCDAFIADYHRGVAKNRENGKKGGRPSSKNNPVGSQSVSDGLPVITHCQGNQEPITNNHEPITNKEQPLTAPLEIQAPKEKKEALATRLQKDWTPSDANQMFCKTERPDISVDLTACQFRDYWIAKPGKDGRKLDWDAVWRNWVRSARSSGIRPSAAKPEKFDPTAYVNRNRISQ